MVTSSISRSPKVLIWVSCMHVCVFIMGKNTHTYINPIKSGCFTYRQAHQPAQLPQYITHWHGTNVSYVAALLPTTGDMEIHSLLQKANLPGEGSRM